MTLQELRKRPHWSFSSLNSLLNICSLQWYFQKILKLKPTHTSVNLVAGSVYHRTLDQVFMARKLEVPFIEAYDCCSIWSARVAQVNIPLYRKT